MTAADIGDMGQICVHLTDAKDGSIVQRILPALDTEMQKHPLIPSDDIHFGPIYRELEMEFNEAKSELATLQMDAAKLFHNFNDRLLFGPPSLRGDVR